MAYHILVVDNNQAFSTILKEGLETTGAFEVTLAHTGADALEAVVEKPFDMVIVDMGLADVEPARLIKAIRDAKPAMRLMLIPLFGQRIAEHLKGVAVQGILPKPFFVGDLPKLVGEALGIPVPAAPSAAFPELQVEVSTRPVSPVKETVPPPPPPVKVPPRAEEKPAVEPLARLRAKEKQIVLLLKNLNRDVRAECILVTLGDQLVAFSGLLGQEQTAQLANLVAETTTAAARAAAFLGEPAGHFEQSLHEGAEYCLYSLVLRDDLVLSLALSPEVPLGTLRYRARQIAAELLDLLT